MTKQSGKIACFTGHRILNESAALKQLLAETTERLIVEGVGSFLCGFARGFDLLAGRGVLEFRPKYSNIKLIAVLPCKNQDKYWHEKERASYKELLTAANEIIYVNNDYSRDCMKKRNAELIRRADYCISYLKEYRSGTGQTVRLAREKGIPVFNLAEMIGSLSQGRN